METAQFGIASLLIANTVWSVAIRGVLWFAVATTIIVSSDNPHPARSLKALKSRLGYLLMIIVLGGGLIYLLFSYVPA